MDQNTSFTQKKKPNIVLIIAGTNDPSNSATLAEYFAKGCQESGAEVTTFRLKDLKIDHFDLTCYDTACSITDQFPLIQEAIKQADGVVFASPIWNFGVPAHLKNLIDRMGSFALDDTHSIGVLHGKPFFLILTGGIPNLGWPLLKRTTSFLPIGIEYFGAAVVGTHFEGSCTLGRGKFGLVVDKRPESLKRVTESGEAYTELVQNFMRTGKLPLYYRIRKAMFKFGQTMKKKLGL